MLVNYHMHTNHTVDATATVDEYAAKAAMLGYDEICITNHTEWGDALEGNFDFALTEEQWESLKLDIKLANERYPLLKIKLGVELDFEPEYAKDSSAFIKKHDFDYVICSMHFLDGMIIADPTKKLPAGTDVRTIYRKYFSNAIELVKKMDFDCIGHLDGIRRSAPVLPASEYDDLLTELAMALISNDKGFEVNTSGWRYGNGGPYPSLEIIKILHDSGVKKVTIGSDCHKVSQFDSGLDEGRALLKKAGYARICTFDKRKAKYVDI